MTPSKHTAQAQRPELTFDGFGINGPDQYRTRIATFVDPHGLGDVARYGRLFAAAPELLEALRRLLASPDLHLDGLEMETVCAVLQAERAISKAEGQS